MNFQPTKHIRPSTFAPQIAQNAGGMLFPTTPRMTVPSKQNVTGVAKQKPLNSFRHIGGQ